MKIRIKPIRKVKVSTLIFALVMFFAGTLFACFGFPKFDYNTNYIENDKLILQEEELLQEELPSEESLEHITDESLESNELVDGAEYEE